MIRVNKTLDSPESDSIIHSKQIIGNNTGNKLVSYT